MESKLQYKVAIRLDPKKPFRPIETCCEHTTFESAQQRIRMWYVFVEDLPKAKPEAIIETEELPHVCDCRNCGHPLFKSDIAYLWCNCIYCYDCSIDARFRDGYYDYVEDLS